MSAKGPFNGKMGSYQWVETQDGHNTLHSSYFDENCHSTAGAMEETFYNFIEGCQISRKLSSGPSNQPLTILEVGFGLGYGPQACYQQWKRELLENKSVRSVLFISLEIDPALVELYSQTHGLSYEYCRQDFYRIKTTQGKSSFELRVYCADARQKVAQFVDSLKTTALIPPVEAIFQDPFSPKKNPTLWTHQWFKQLRKLSAKDVILSTYSASIAARKAMLVAGWFVANRKGFAHKKSATVANLELVTDKNTQRLVEKTKVCAYSDDSLE